MKIWSLLFLLILFVIVLSKAGRNFYKILGVQRSATQKEIKKAYKALSLKFHPDKNPGNAEAREKYQEINDAYEALGNEEKRRKYDWHGEEGLKQ